MEKCKGPYDTSVLQFSAFLFEDQCCIPGTTNGKDNSYRRAHQEQEGRIKEEISKVQTESLGGAAVFEQLHRKVDEITSR